MIVAVIQSRYASKRLPGKAMAEVLPGLPLLGSVIERAKRIEGVDQVILATSAQPENDVLEALGEQAGVHVVRGGENDVVGRFMLAARNTDASHIMRLTGDNPLLDWAALSHLVAAHVEKGADYSALTGLPVGTSADMFSRAALEATHESGRGEALADHVDLHVLENQDIFHCQLVALEPNLAHYRMTVDTDRDLDAVRRLLHFGDLAADTLASTLVPDLLELASAGHLLGALASDVEDVSAENQYTSTLVAKVEDQSSVSGEHLWGARSMKLQPSLYVS